MTNTHPTRRSAKVRPMQVLNVRLPKEDVAWLRSYADAEQRPLTQIVRLAVEEYRKARSTGDRVPAVQS